MTVRIHFLLPDATLAQTVVADLEQAGIPESAIHLIGNDRDALADLPLAGLGETTQLGHGLALGLGLGALAGALGGVLTLLWHPAGVAVGGAALLGCAIVGAGCGAGVSALIARDLPHPDLAGYRRGILAGMVLVLVDLPRQRLEEISALVIKHHPEVRIGQVRPPRHDHRRPKRITHVGHALRWHAPHLPPGNGQE